MFTFRDPEREEGRFAARICAVLRGRHAMHVGELCLRLGVEEARLREHLEAMAAEGTVELLRPIGATSGEHDFFRLREPAPAAPCCEPPGNALSVGARAEQVQWAGRALACVAE